MVLPILLARISTVRVQVPTDTYYPLDGMNISVLNDTLVSVIDTATGWLTGQSDLLTDVRANSNDVARDLAWPADYTITFYDSPQDTTYNTHFPVNFKVYNETLQKYSKIAVYDYDNSHSLTVGDLIQIIEFEGAPITANFRKTWNLTYAPFDSTAVPVEPQAGDKFVIRTTKPFRAGDYFNFTTKQLKVDNSLAKDGMAKIGVVPNPYLGCFMGKKKS